MQVKAFLAEIGRARAEELRGLFHVTLVASRGSKESVEKMAKELLRIGR